MAYRAVGVTRVIVSPRAPYDAAMLELLAEQVMPAIRQRMSATR
jgi:hypothetical protein